MLIGPQTPQEQALRKLRCRQPLTLPPPVSNFNYPVILKAEAESAQASLHGISNGPIPLPAYDSIMQLDSRSSCFDTEFSEDAGLQSLHGTFTIANKCWDLIITPRTSRIFRLACVSTWLSFPGQLHHMELCSFPSLSYGCSLSDYGTHGWEYCRKPCTDQRLSGEPGAIGS